VNPAKYIIEKVPTMDVGIERNTLNAEAKLPKNKNTIKIVTIPA
jgi:hypothetical protein